MNILRALTEARSRNTASTAAQTSLSDTSAQLLAANNNRKGLVVQNTGTTVIKLILGAGTVTQSVYHVALQAAAAADDGSGGVYLDDAWTGAVQGISSAAGGTLVITEVTSVVEQ